jgi:diguanylate cyclase (GGDEF)-like protein
MQNNSPGRFASRKGTMPAREKVKYVLLSVFCIIMVLNVSGFYPEIPFNALFSAIVYASFFAAFFLLEKNYGMLERRAAARLYYAVFAVMLTFTSVSGGIASPLKWAVYILVFAAAASGLYLHAGIMLALLFISFLRHVSALNAGEIFLFIAAAVFITVYYFTGGKKQEPESEKIPAYDLESGRENRDFRAIASELLEKLLNVYRTLTGAETLLFFLREPAVEGEYSLMMFSSNNPAGIDRDYRMRIKEGILGAAINKKEFFAFDAGGIRMPYYTSRADIKEAVTLPVISGGRIIGAVAADFTAEPAAKEYLKSRLQNLSSELIGIMQLFEINQKVMAREKRVSLLYDIYGKLNLLDGKKEMMRAFFEEIKSFDVYSGYLAEFLPEEKSFEVTESFNYPGNIAGTKFGSREDEIIKYIFETGGHMIVEGAAEKNIRTNFKRMNIDRFFIAMLRSKADIFGFIKLDKEKGFGFNEFEVKTLQMILSRITTLLENIRLYEKIKKQACEDGLTGLYNHFTFQEMLARSLEKKETGEVQYVSLCLIDIDFFKKFNDSFGHQEGDRVLKKLAAALKEFAAKHEGCYAARYGGEEFVFVMENYDLYKAGRIAEEIRAFSEENLSGGDSREKRPITLSIGITSFPGHARNTREMIKSADDALYAAKQEGRNRVKSILDLKKS